MADSNLLQRGTTWYARLSAPATLQRALFERGKKPRADLFRSLGTGDKLEAKRRLPAKLTQMHQQFADEEAALRSEAPELHEPSEYDLQTEAFDLVRRELLLDDQERASRPTREQAIAAVQALRLDLERNPPKTSLEREVREINILNRASPDRSEFRHDLQAELKESRRTNSFHLIDWAIQDAAQRRQWRLPPDSPRYKLLPSMPVAARITFSVADAFSHGFSASCRYASSMYSVRFLSSTWSKHRLLSPIRASWIVPRLLPKSNWMTRLPRQHSGCWGAWSEGRCVTDLVMNVMESASNRQARSVRPDVGSSLIPAQILRAVTNRSPRVRRRAPGCSCRSQPRFGESLQFE